MGILGGLVNNDNEKNSQNNKDENNSSLQKELKEEAENRNKISAYEEEKLWQEANLREEEYNEKLITSEQNYLKVKELFALINVPDSEIEQKVREGELTLTVIDKMKFYLSKIDRTVLRQRYEETNWEVIRENIDTFEEYVFVKGNLISRCLNK